MKFDTLKLTGAIFDNATILKETQDITIGTLPITWDSNTLFNCDFTTIYGGNPAGYNIDNISYLVIKRQKQGQTNWITLVKVPVNNPEDLILEHHDYFNQHGVQYTYALVEIDPSGNESTYETKTIQSCFNKVFIVDGFKSYDLTNSTNYNNYQRNQQTGIYETFGRKYPIAVMNGVLDYYSMSTSAYLIKDNKTNDFDYIEQKDYIKEFTAFLNNKKAKMLKDYNGNMWLIVVNGGISIDPIVELGNSIARVSFNWAEIGDCDNEKDLQSARLIPVKPVYSQTI